LKNFTVDTTALNEQFEGWDAKVNVKPVLPTGEEMMSMELTGD